MKETFVVTITGEDGSLRLRKIVELPVSDEHRQRVEKFLSDHGVSLKSAIWRVAETAVPRAEERRAA